MFNNYFSLVFLFLFPSHIYLFAVQIVDIKYYLDSFSSLYL